jgi:hypothetical protein
VEPIRYVPDLDHLRHAISISPARCMRYRSGACPLHLPD